MKIDPGSFLMLVSAIAMGGAVGYVAAEKRVFPAVDTWVGRVPGPLAEAPRPIATASAPPPPVSVAPPAPTAPAPPPCDDSVAATVGDCPGPGLPTVEGGCGSFANVRCGELKQSLKPRVAAAAVDCIAKLSPRDRCDPTRVNLCGHLALMNACPDGPGLGSDAGATAATSACQSILDTCGTSPIAPSTTECRQLLSGMNEAGRDRTRTCMKQHCFDRGLIGCEATAAAAPR